MLVFGGIAESANAQEAQKQAKDKQFSLNHVNWAKKINSAWRKGAPFWLCAFVLVIVSLEFCP